MKFLPPLPLKQKYYKIIEKKINLYFLKNIYYPLVELFQPVNLTLKNSLNSLLDSIKEGRIVFDGKTCHGKFNAELSKELRKLGATYNAKAKSWSFRELPPEISTAIGIAELRFSALKKRIVSTLDEELINETLAKVDFTKEYEEVIVSVEKNFVDGVKAITVPPKLTPEIIQAISLAYSNNLKLYIKDWAAKNILELRKKVETNTYYGYRSSNLVDTIRDNYGVSQRKAKFLARQETSLLVSRLREERYKSIGSQSYKWIGVMDERERKDHKLLEGKIFFWSSPPIVDRKTGRRANPGEDYNCRCVAVPILN